MEHKQKRLLLPFQYSNFLQYRKAWESIFFVYLREYKTRDKEWDVDFVPEEEFNRLTSAFNSNEVDCVSEEEFNRLMGVFNSSDYMRKDLGL